MAVEFSILIYFISQSILICASMIKEDLRGDLYLLSFTEVVFESKLKLLPYIVKIMFYLPIICCWFVYTIVEPKIIYLFYKHE